MAPSDRRQIVTAIDCACVIHSDKYEWQYVDRLHSMLTRHLDREIRLHVWTEPHRRVPDPYVRHDLIDWPGISGPRKSWWYKLQMFDPSNGITGPLLYFDLDLVVVGDLTWITQLPCDRFWAVKDFRYLWRQERVELNSSIMYWPTKQYNWIWEDFMQRDRAETVRKYPGDQDYLNAVIPKDQIGFLDTDRVRSYRWQVKDGGFDHKSRTYRRPGAGANITETDRIIVFHGDPKPHQVYDAVIQQNWC